MGRGDPAPPRSVTVVVPARDRVDALGRCLASLGHGHPIVVVDDASADAGAVAAVGRAHGARTVRRAATAAPAPPGPRRARSWAPNSSPSSTATAPCPTAGSTISPGSSATPPSARWRPVSVRRTRPAPAPGPRPLPGARSPLDLGADEGEVGPDRAVRYVPTAALVVRRAALDAVGGFAPGMRVGEDVDLVWRLVGAGWRVRYVPSVTVSHAETGPLDGGARPAVHLRHVGRTAGPAAPGAPRPRRAAPPTIAGRARPAGRPTRPGRRNRGHVGRPAGPQGPAARDPGPPGLEVERRRCRLDGRGPGTGDHHAGVAGLLALAAAGRRGRVAATALAVVPPTVDWLRKRPDLDLPRWMVASVADDVAYGLGVWTGCLRERTLGPLLPTLRGDRQS